MIPIQLKMGATIVGLAREKAATGAQLQKVQVMEHDMERKECRLNFEHAARSELEAEVAQKEKLASNILEA